MRPSSLLGALFLSLTIGASHLVASPEAEPSFNEVLVHHLMDAPIFEWQPGGVKVYKGEEGYEKDPYKRFTFVDHDGRQYKYAGGLPLHITKRVMMMFIVWGILLIVLIYAGRKIAASPYPTRNKLAAIVESLVTWLRDEIAEPNMHHHSKGFQPFLFTLFFFILTCNLVGLFPPFGEITEMIYNAATGHQAEAGHHAISPIIAIWPGITVTGDIAVTASFAVITMIMIWVTGFKYQGPKFLWHVVPDGVPFWLYPLMWPLEFIIGPLAKGFALAIRLLANMTAGHVVILALLFFIFQFKSQFIWLVPVSVVGAGAIYLLEVLVAFLQAFIFTLLASLFIGSSMHRH